MWTGDKTLAERERWEYYSVNLPARAAAGVRQEAKCVGKGTRQAFLDAVFVGRSLAFPGIRMEPEAKTYVGCGMQDARHIGSLQQGLWAVA